MEVQLQRIVTQHIVPSPFQLDAKAKKKKKKAIYETSHVTGNRQRIQLNITSIDLLKLTTHKLLINAVYVIIPLPQLIRKQLKSISNLQRSKCTYQQSKLERGITSPRYTATNKLIFCFYKKHKIRQQGKNNQYK